MKRCDNVTASAAFTGATRFIFKGIPVIFLLFFFGCATISPQPVTIRHERTPSLSDAAMQNQQYRNEPADQNIAAQEQLQRNAISTEEAGRHTEQSVPSAAGETGVVVSSETSEKDRAEKMTASPNHERVEALQEQIQRDLPKEIKETATEGIGTTATTDTQEHTIDLPEQAQEPVREELPKDIREKEKKQDEKISRNISQELGESLSEQVKEHVREESPAESKESEQQRIDRITTRVTQELMKSLPELIRKQVQEELPKEIKEVEQKVEEKVERKVEQKVEQTAALPDWIKRIRFGGDIRLRYENDRFDKNNADFAQPSNPTQLMNTKIDADRFKYRVRIGAAIDVNDQVEAVVRLSTGNSSNPVSTNTIIGDYMNKDNVLFDLAYLKWQPTDFLTISGGRMPNPWFTPTWLVWDDDLNFEGLALTVKKPVTESLSSFLTIGAFPLQQDDFTQHGKWLTAGQLGIERQSPKGFAAKIGAAYYNFSNITGILNDPLHPGETDWTAPLFQQKGNTLFNISSDPSVFKTALASEFKEINLSGTLDIGLWDPFHIVFVGDYVKNIGFDKSDVAQRTGISNPTEDTTGYQIGMTLGHPTIKEGGQWKAYFQYVYKGADSVVDAFTFSDFHLGGTNAKGWILGGDVALRKNVWLSVEWLTANEISGPPLAIDVLFVDFNARF